MSTSTSHSARMSTEDIPEWGTPEFKVWWESQYAPAESHHVGNIEYVTGSSLELNTIFYELENDASCDWVGK